MAEFIKGLDLCRGFFHEAAEPILERHFPELRYSAGLIGYGSDVLGYDDPVSCDHMWGPRFYFFLDPADIGRKEEVFDAFSRELPYEYKGYSVNFTVPDPNDNGVQHPEFITSGRVNPLIFIQTFDEFLEEQLGTSALDSLTAADWLTFSEHRLLSLTAGEWFRDGLNLSKRLDAIRFYPEDVRRYRIAANWDIIASEQAFVRRCADVGDDLGSVIVAARIAERLMRLCFLYKKQYAPYSKWFGTAFAHPKLDVPQELKDALYGALHAGSIAERENALVRAQALTAALHNESGITAPVEYEVESYYGREIKVIFANKFAEAVLETLEGTALAEVPLIDTFSALGGISNVSDDLRYSPLIRTLYE
ncbi:MAG: DUF4037 domain-containing protein [Clostridia bacterium]|nr:DUF4037 domain-containing protein [Clostridia bacterium]